MAKTTLKASQVNEDTIQDKDNDTRVTVEESADDSFGFNGLTGEFEDLVKAGVIVPTKVERVALQNAASISGLLLTTDCAISDIKEDAPPAAPAGMDGMGF